ncbi:MAG TPA: autotransporter outer membrane beta-barrel domain-containing protein [Stellaceae bacterium]|nr:autotransporter outer membrane beta-barrel domain-containing protein [Stellaceae bacterium]
MNGRILTERLLATTSLAALIFATGTPNANALTPCTVVAAGASYSNSGAVTCVTAPNTSVSITNNAGGTIGPAGSSTASVGVSGTLSGGITNAGTISGSFTSGISNAAVLVSGLVQGGITNSGTITAASTGSAANYGAIAISGALQEEISFFGGGLTNGGTLSASAVGSTANVITINVSTFSGGIANNGTITGSLSNTDYAELAGVNLNGELFTGGIVNSGAINVTTVNSGSSCCGTAQAAGIVVNAATFANGIVNSGTISAKASSSGGCCGSANATGVTISGTMFTGGILNSGTVSASATVSNSGFAEAEATGIAIDVFTFTGGFTNNGTISASAIVTSSTSSSAYATGLSVYGTSFGVGNIVNNGAIIASAAATNSFCGRAFVEGVVVGSSIFTGSIVNNGTISAHATITGATCGRAYAQGVGVSVSAFTGSIVNNGTIAASVTVAGSADAEGGALGLGVFAATFTGGISNAGLISATATATGSGMASDRLSATGIEVDVGTFSGGISNSGTILATAVGATAASEVPIGIAVDTDTFIGDIANSGTISVSASASVAGEFRSTGINVDTGIFTGNIVNSGAINASVTAGVGDSLAYGVSLFASTLTGGLSNGGTISASAISSGTSGIVEAEGVYLSLSKFSGSIVNSGQINATAMATGTGLNCGVAAIGIELAASSFGGAPAPAISNSGSIIARAGSNGTDVTAIGVALYGESAFSGSIVNSGTIAGLITKGTGLGVGIGVWCAGALTITNSGLVEGTTWGIRNVNTATNAGALTINLTGGTIMGSTTTAGGAIGLSSHADVLNISGGTIIGNVVGGGTANTVNVNMGTGSFNYAYEIEGIGTLNLKSGTLLLQNLTGPGVSTASYNQSAGSTLALEVSPAASNNHASLLAGGTVSLAAGSVFEAYEGAFGWTPGTYTYAGVVTGDTITGSFVTAGSNSPFFTASLAQSSAVDNLTLTMLSPSQVPGLNANQQSVANAIIGIPGGNSTLDQIFLLPGSSTSSGPSAGLPTLGNALTQLSGSQYSTTNYQPLIASWQTFTESLTDRLSQGNGYGGTVTGSLDPSHGIQFAMADIPQLAQSGVVTDGDTRTLRGAPPRAASQWGVWGRGYGLTSNAPSTATSASYSESGAGLIIGADNQITDRIVAGVALNVSTDKATVTGGGFTQTNAYEGSVYGQYSVDPNWYVNGMAGFGWQTYKTARVVSLLATSVDNGSFSGQSYNLYGESGYALHPAFLPQTRITPYAGLGYLHTHTDGFTESGTTALNVQAMDPNSFTLSLGARVATTLQIGSTVFRPELRAAWQHEFLDSSATMRASFVAAPGSTFTSTGASFGDDSFLGGAGITTTITASTQIFLDYDARVTGGYTAQAVSGGLRVQF